MYQWSKLQKTVLPTIADALKAIQFAEQKDNPDPRPLMQTLSRLPVADARRLGLQMSINDDLTGFDWEVRPLKQFNDDKKVQRLAMEAYERLAASDYLDHLPTILSARFIGVAGLKQTFERDFSGKKIATLEPIPAVQLWYHKGTNGPAFFVLGEGDSADAKEISAAEREGYILARFNPFVSSDPYYIGGLDRTALWLILLKHVSWQDWGDFNEKYGDPTLLAKHKPTATDADKTAAWSMLEELGKNRRALVSEDIMIEVVKTMMSETAQSYEKVVQKIDDALSVLYLGSTLGTDVADKGTYGAAKVHLTKEEKRTWSNIKFVEQITTHQHLAVDYRLNVGASNGPMPYEFRARIEEAVDYESNARTLNDLSAAGYEPMEIEEVSQKVGFKVRKSAAPTVPPANIPPADITAN